MANKPTVVATPVAAPMDMAAMMAMMQQLLAAQAAPAAPAAPAAAPAKAVKAVAPAADPAAADPTGAALVAAVKANIRFVRWDVTEGKKKPYAVVEIALGGRVSKACIWM